MHLVTEKGAGRVRVDGKDLPVGTPLDASKWPTRSTFENLGYIRFVTEDEYEGAKALQEAKEEAEAKATSPFSDFSEAVQKSLEAAGIKTVEQVKALGKDELVKLKGIGDVTADELLAL